jgi:hypothetical protein
MTGFAGKPRMLVLKRKACFGVIEIAFFFYRIKRLRGMTFRTVLPELIVMRVLMTAVTNLILQSRKFLEFLAFGCGQLVTLNAGYGLVFPR